MFPDNLKIDVNEAAEAPEEYNPTGGPETITAAVPNPPYSCLEKSSRIYRL